MGGLIQQTPLAEEKNSTSRAIVLGIAAVVLVVGVIAVLLRTRPKTAALPHPYATNVKLSDFKMSAAENFVGATVSYVDGTVSNSGDKTLSHAVVHVAFKNSLGEVVQGEDLPLHVLQTSGPYPEAVDLSKSLLAPGQSKPFRLTFEHVSSDWNHEYPEIQVMDVSLK